MKIQTQFAPTKADRLTCFAATMVVRLLVFKSTVELGRRLEKDKLECQKAHCS